MDRTEWREEVQLASGEVVVVKRTAIRDKSGFPASRRGAIREWAIVFPDGRAVWKSDGSMIPIALEIRDSNAYVVANIRSRDYCAQFNNPPSSVVFFRWDSMNWIRIVKNEYPTNGRANLLLSPWGGESSDDARGLVNNKDKYLAKPYNNGVNDPLEAVLSDRSLDACDMLKRN